MYVGGQTVSGPTLAHAEVITTNIKNQEPSGTSGLTIAARSASDRRPAWIMQVSLKGIRREQTELLSYSSPSSLPNISLHMQICTIT